MRHSQLGTNLFELSVTLSVAAILLSIGIPSMLDFNARRQLQAARVELMSSLQAARMHAVSHGKHVLLCPSDDGEICADGTDWSGGWIVFVDTDRNRERDTGDTLLWRGSVDHAQQRISTTRGRTRIRYSPLGTAPGTNLSITLCHRALPQTSSKLIVSNAGRARVLVDAGPAVACST